MGCISSRSAAAEPAADPDAAALRVAAADAPAEGPLHIAPTFDPTKVVTAESHTSETDEGTAYGTSTTSVYHDGKRFYSYSSSVSSNCGGCRGEEHTATLAGGGRTLRVRVSDVSRTVGSKGKGETADTIIDLGVEWDNYVSRSTPQVA